MQITALARRLLQLIFALSSSSTALTRPRLARRLDVPTEGLNDAIAELGRQGLIDAQQMRLTFPGLAVAVADGAHSAKAKPRAMTTKAATASTAARSPIALFAQSEARRAVA